MKNRTISCLLVLVLCIGMLQFPVFAAEEDSAAETAVLQEIDAEDPVLTEESDPALIVEPGEENNNGSSEVPENTKEDAIEDMDAVQEQPAAEEVSETDPETEEIQQPEETIAPEVIPETSDEETKTEIVPEDTLSDPEPQISAENEPSADKEPLTEKEEPAEKTEEETKEDPAEQEPIVGDIQTGTEEIILSEELGDPDALFDAYLEEEVFDLKAANASAATTKRLSGMNAKIYAALCKGVINVAAGTQTSTEFMITAEDLGFASTKWTAKDLGVSALRENNAIPQAALTAAGNKLAYNSQLILYTLIVERPYDFYWHDRFTGVMLTKALRCTVTYDSAKGCDVMMVSGYLKFAHPVSPAYSAGQYQVNTTMVNKAKKAAANAKAIVTKYQGYSDYNKLLAYKNEICNLTSYNTNAARYGDSTGAHLQMIGVFDGDPGTTVVCEGYSKAFQYLCDLSTFQKSVVCKTVMGDMGSTASGSSGRHMWNVVNMGNGRNYLVDVTNCDSGTAGAPNYLFMVPYTAGSSGRYYFQCPGQQIWYSYDANTLALYSTTELTISGAAYNVGADTQRIPLVGTSFKISDKTYTGKAIKPTPAVNLNGLELTKGKDYTLSYKNNVNKGTATLTLTGIGGYTGTVSTTFKIVARSLAAAKVTNLTSKAYTGKALTISPTVKMTISGKTYTLKKGTDYTLSFKNNKNVGYATVTITGKGNYKGTLSKKFKIVPKATSLVSLNAGTRKMTVKWKKQTTQTAGYQIQYSLSSSFLAGNKNVLVTPNTAVSKTISGLTSGKKYFVRIRPYKKVSGTTFYGPWSSSLGVLIP